MAYENIINKVIETQKKQTLCKVVIYGNKIGPTRPRGHSSVTGYYTKFLQVILTLKKLVLFKLVIQELYLEIMHIYQLQII